MTFAQLVATADSDLWKNISEALATVLAGMLGFIGQRTIRTMDALSKEVVVWGKAINDWNNERHIWQGQIESRLHEGETESIDHHDRLVAVERIVDRRRKPRTGA